jgi:CubicO group peptidase (beta-lactamase class C family)
MRLRKHCSHGAGLSKFAALLALEFAFLSATVGVLFAQDAKLAPEKRTQIEQAISKFMAANQVPGISAAVVENGQYAWSAGFGMADLEQFVPATSQTLYRLASVSKSLTAVATMQLFERGKLDLDAPVQKY